MDCVGESHLSERVNWHISQEVAEYSSTAQQRTAVDYRDGRPSYATLDARAPYPFWSPLVHMRPEGSRTPLFCVHGILGNVLNFEPLVRHLPLEQPVYGLEARGLNGGLPHTSIEEMAQSYVAAMRTVQHAGPYHIAGYSAGGVVAFEMARQLWLSGEDVGFVGLLDASLHPRSLSAVSPAHALGPIGRVRKLGRMTGRFLTMTPSDGREALLRNWNRCCQLFATSMHARKQALAQRCGVTVKGPEDLEEAFLFALRQYRPSTFDGPITLFRATSGVGRDDQRAAMGWDAVAPAVKVELYDVGHPAMLREPAVIDVARSIDLHLRQASAVAHQNCA